VRSGLGLPADAVVATMIARVTRSKGIPEFAQVARSVGARRPEARFLLVGPDDRDSIDRLDERELGELRSAVIWPGARRDVAAVLAASDLFVLPTAYREGIPRVLLDPWTPFAASYCEQTPQVHLHIGLRSPSRQREQENRGTSVCRPAEET